MARAPDPDLSARLRSLVDRDFAGSVNRAARAWGVPQPTLFRFVERNTKAPNARALLKIARFYDTTVEWLMEGVGRGPAETEYPVQEFTAWSKLVKELELPDYAERPMFALPGRIGVANVVLCDWGIFSKKWEGQAVLPEKRRESERLAKWKASALELEAWTVWLRALITTYGRTAVREKILSEADRLRLGFQRFAIYLYDSGRIALDLQPIYDQEFHPPGVAPHSEHLNDPVQPPLTMMRPKQR